jgi:hypothetical protein
MNGEVFLRSSLAQATGLCNCKAMAPSGGGLARTSRAQGEGEDAMREARLTMESEP